MKRLINTVLVCSTISLLNVSPMLKASDCPCDQRKPFKLPCLSYKFDALEPYIDAKTMNIHYNKHHRGYVDKLNAALKDYPDLQKKSLFWLVTNLQLIPATIRTSVRNNGGGHFAHSLYWNSMSPQGPRRPSGALATAINQSFGSFKNFKNQFEKQAGSLFGSGWTWLCCRPDGRLEIISTPGHDVPMAQGFRPILVIDVWEHAYYLKYQNRRGAYINSWWNIINWPQLAPS